MRRKKADQSKDLFYIFKPSFRHLFDFILSSQYNQELGGQYHWNLHFIPFLKKSDYKIKKLNFLTHKLQGIYPSARLVIKIIKIRNITCSRN